jgi:hypothetical protein
MAEANYPEEIFFWKKALIRHNLNSPYLDHKFLFVAIVFLSGF